MNKVTSSLVLILSIFILASCSKQTIPIQINNKNVDNLFSIQLGNKYKVKNSYTLKPEPVSVYGDTSKPLIITDKDEEYIVESINSKYVKIKSNGKEGWIPGWYLTEEASKVKKSESVFKLIKNSTSLSIYPNEINPEDNKDPNLILTLEEGCVVKVIGEYNDWYNVKFIQYVAGIWGDRWIKKETSTDYDYRLSKEGLTKSGTTIYDMGLNQTEESYHGVARVKSEKINDKGTFYLIRGIAGVNGYIKKEDFNPNPFGD